MSSGHSRISGIRARMELAWSKERAEHQRLIQDTSKLAEELKNTLHEVRDKRRGERRLGTGWIGEPVWYAAVWKVG